MVRHYTLGADDLVLIRTKRRSINRLGFAIQLCLLKYPGLGMGPVEQPPEAMIAFVAHQLGVPSADFADYAQRDQVLRGLARKARMMTAHSQRIAPSRAGASKKRTSARPFAPITAGSISALAGQATPGHHVTGLTAAPTRLLNRRAWDSSERAEHAAVAGLRAQ
jgi:hypothetical protein